MTTTLNLICNKFKKIYTNKSDTETFTLNLNVTSNCGGVTTLNVYELGTNNLVDSSLLPEGDNAVQVDPRRYLAVYCKTPPHDGGGGCIAKWDLM